MRLVLLTSLVMVAFAGNSVLNRLAVDQFAMDPVVFAGLRTLAGACALAGLVWARGGRLVLGRKRWAGAAALAAYMTGFSWAYLTLGAGLGALILFGVLQIVMFGFAQRRGQDIPPLRWVGAVIALIGLAVLLWPGATDRVPLLGALAMGIAGVAWAVYTLLGQGEPDALGASAGNFVLAVPLVACVLLGGWGGTLSWPGVALAVIAGAVTSGMGYALWYRVLPEIPTTIAAVTQLSVPVIAVLAGIVFLGESLTLRMVCAAGLILGGIGVSLLAVSAGSVRARRK